MSSIAPRSGLRRAGRHRSGSPRASAPTAPSKMFQELAPCVDRGVVDEHVEAAEAVDRRAISRATSSSRLTSASTPMALSPSSASAAAAARGVRAHPTTQSPSAAAARYGLADSLRSTVTITVRSAPSTDRERDGRTGAPVLPSSLRGNARNANSRTPAAARSSSHEFSRTGMPTRAIRYELHREKSVGFLRRERLAATVDTDAHDLCLLGQEACTLHAQPWRGTHEGVGVRPSRHAPGARRATSACLARRRRRRSGRRA